ncbi:MAG TPA: Holliday junction ATP-dependent DNA helicase RuvA [Candidatus Omnitrophota bacterium]|nr:Holliday junction branch migration protein RuvA [Candidatus Omnitrophota bacterium]HPB69028.1 Holliday junction ATP-dependent DNA helicase RuvA [Candidatus Omnitrophota bacterium]HQO58557.1 Holliday junction ATP-dependent DNA helicase RuvA [Candidatus Omnitrophota bacterium]
MITKISGQLVEKKNNSVIIEVEGIGYEVLVPYSILQRVDVPVGNRVELMTYHYIQITPGGGFPYLVGFLNEVEKDFFLQFIKVSGIGPRAAVKALDKPISDISDAIDRGDLQYLKSLPGIGLQRAKEIVAKLQGKVGRFGLIQDKGRKEPPPAGVPDWQEEVLSVLMQLQYKKPEAMAMIDKALQRCPHISDAEHLINEIYKQRNNYS